jgi:hypothetical protein
MYITVTVVDRLEKPIGWSAGSIIFLFGVFPLATPRQHSIWFYGPVTEGAVRLKAFTGLAHDIQALQYFTLPSLVDQYPNTFDGSDDGILGRDGDSLYALKHLEGSTAMLPASVLL